MRSIQGRLGSKRRMERRRKKRNAAPDAKAHRGRDRKREDGNRLGDEKGTGSMLPVQKKGTLYEQM